MMAGLCFALPDITTFFSMFTIHPNSNNTLRIYEGRIRPPFTVHHCLETSFRRRTFRSKAWLAYDDCTYNGLLSKIVFTCAYWFRARFSFTTTTTTATFAIAANQSYLELLELPGKMIQQISRPNSPDAANSDLSGVNKSVREVGEVNGSCVAIDGLATYASLPPLPLRSQDD
jgi:hypothetical protein